jgi:DNA modification methylase
MIQITAPKRSNIQMSLFDYEQISYQSDDNIASSSTFINNMSLPIHRWFRYSAGFSAQWVEQTIRNIISAKNSNAFDVQNFVVLDPFVGSGTTLLAAEQVGVSGIGFESHPLISRIAGTKLLWNTDVNSFRDYANGVLYFAQSHKKNPDHYAMIVQRCYNPENLTMIDLLKYALAENASDSNEHHLSWLAFLSILRSTSHAGTAQWQYVLPNRSKTRVLSVFDAYKMQVELMCADMLQFASSASPIQGHLFQHDARQDFFDLDNSVDMIITSPPYANNYDYADATRLEMCVLGEINGWGDLQQAVRPSLIRSCSQHVSKEKNKTFDFLADPLLEPIQDEIFNVCTRLDEEKDFHGGKKNYHTMIALYFLDLAKVWKNLRRMCKNNSEICFVIGDSAPYGIYVPVDEWLGKLAIAAGFRSYYFEKTRDRNIKWKNRKHRVPLKEGQLWIKG